MRKIFLLLMFFAGLLLGCPGQGNSTADFVERTVALDGKQYRFRVFVPKARDPNKKLPVMLYLHGGGSRGDDNNAPAATFAAAIAPVKDKINFIVVLPQCKNGTFWASSEMANQALAALDASVKEFNGDPQRLYLAGFSLGGYGTWQIAAGYPGKFAALMPVAGGVVGHSPIDPRDRAIIIPAVGTMLDSSEPYGAIAKAIGQTPVWVFHGSKDEAVPVEFSRKIVKALTDAGSKNVSYTEFPDEGHLIFGKAIAEPGFFEWLAERKLLNKN